MYEIYTFIIHKNKIKILMNAFYFYLILFYIFVNNKKNTLWA